MIAASETADIRRLSARRAVEPAVTLERVRPLLRPMGITRIANITGLDRIGLPVVNVVRPNSRSNSVSQGKGLDLDAAKASAVMESVEAFCAEHIDKALKFARAEEMTRRHRIANIDALPRPRGSRFDAGTPILWIEGRDLASGVGVWVPFELVHANFTVPAAAGSGHFLLSSNGLASGNTMEEAIAHALGELIERDAGALFDATDAGLTGRRIVPASIDEPNCQLILDRVRAAGLTVAFWDITSDVGVAAIRCQIMETADAVRVLPLPALGEGCHPERNVALLRALTEAAQARLSVIAGVRDDIGPDMYMRSDDPDLLAHWLALLSQTTGGRRFHEVPDRRIETAGDEVAYLLACLARAGLKQAIAIDLTPPDIGQIAVVRVIVPGLDPPSEANCLSGQRCQAVGRAA
jgi:YcaO-like protein with predicted kinase domain